MFLQRGGGSALPLFLDIPCQCRGTGVFTPLPWPGSHSDMLGQAAHGQAPKLQVHEVPKPLLNLELVPCCAQVSALKVKNMLRCFSEKLTLLNPALWHHQALFKCSTKAALEVKECRLL